MPNEDDAKPVSPPRPAAAGLPEPGGEFVAACDWGENWGRIALRNEVSGAEILFVLPFRAEEGARPEDVARQLYSQARPHLNKAMRTIIAKAWEDDS